MFNQFQILIFLLFISLRYAEYYEDEEEYYNDIGGYSLPPKREINQQRRNLQEISGDTVFDFEGDDWVNPFLDLNAADQYNIYIPCNKYIQNNEKVRAKFPDMYNSTIYSLYDERYQEVDIDKLKFSMFIVFEELDGDLQRWQEDGEDGEIIYHRQEKNVCDLEKLQFKLRGTDYQYTKMAELSTVQINTDVLRNDAIPTILDEHISYRTGLVIFQHIDRASFNGLVLMMVSKIHLRYPNPFGFAYYDVRNVHMTDCILSTTDGSVTWPVIENYRSLQTYMRNVQFYDIYALNQGSNLMISTVGIVRLYNVHINRFTGWYGEGAFVVKFCDDVIVDGILVENGYGNASGSGAFYSTTNLIVRNFKFLKNQVYGNGGGFKVNYCTNVILEDGELIENSNQFDGGGVQLFQIHEKVTLTNIFVKKNDSNKGSGILIMYCKTVILENVDFYENNGQEGSVYVQEVNNFVINGSTFEDNYSDAGSGVYIQNTNLQKTGRVSFTNCDFLRNVSKNKSTFFMQGINDGEDIVLTDLTFVENNVTQGFGAGMHFQEIEGNISIYNIDFLNNDSLNPGSFVIENCVGCQIYDLTFEVNKGGLYLYDGENVLIRDITFNRISETPVIVDVGENCEINNLTITNNKATQIAGIHLSGLKNSNVNTIVATDGEAILYGGVLIEFCKNSEFSNFTVKNNSASDKYGGMKFNSNENLTITNLEITDNSSFFYSGGLSFEKQVNITVTDIEVLNNNAGDNGGGIYIFNSDDITMENVVLKDNTAQKSGGGMSATLVDGLTIRNITIQNNQSTKGSGGGIYLETCDDVTVKKLDISNNSGLNGGGFYFISVENLTFQDGEIHENTSSIDGGAFLISESQNLKIFNTKLLDNTASINGGCGYLRQVENFTLEKFQVQGSSSEEAEGGAFYIKEESENVIFKNGSLENCRGFDRGGGIYIENCNEIQVNNVIFDNNFAQSYGGSIYSTNTGNLTVIDSEFINHMVDSENSEDQPIEKGSCIYVENGEEINVKNSIFNDNKANLEGGAIYISQSGQINIENSQFNRNRLEQTVSNLVIGGGSIYIEKSQGLFFNYNSIYDSFAKQYGGGIFIQDVLSIVMKESLFQRCSGFFDENLPLFSKTQDYFISQGGGIYIETNQNPSCNMIFEDTNFSECKASSGGGILINNNFNKDITLVIEQLRFEDNIADLGPMIRILGDYKIQGVFSQYATNVGLNVGLLDAGYIYQGYYYNERKISGNLAQFELCKSNYEQQVGGSNQCTKCDEEQKKCDGGYIPVYPQQEYWRKDILSQEFIHCSSKPEACLKNDTCLLGHAGKLCEKCDYINNYANSQDFSCSLCAEKPTVMFNVILLFIASTFILGNQIRGVYVRVKRNLFQKCMNLLFCQRVFNRFDQLPGITKIFVTHLQVALLVTSFTLEIPSGLQASVQIFGDPHKVLSKSLTCLVDVDNSDQVTKYDFQISLFGLIITVGTLFAILSVEFGLFAMKKIITKFSTLKAFTKCSIICFYLMIYPGLLQNSLNYSICRKIGDVSYNSADTNIECDSNFHKYSVLPVNIILVILIGVFIPASLIRVLLKAGKSDTLHKIDLERSLGILYNEYQGKYYFWEVLTISMKIFIVVMSIVYQQQLAIKTVLLLTGLGIYTVLCLQYKPYVTQKLNKLSLISMATLILTVILIKCQKAIEDQDEYNYFTFISQIVLILLNTVFLFSTVYEIFRDPNLEYQFRSIILLYNKKLSFMNRLIDGPMVKEKKAKTCWKNIQIGIHLANKLWYKRNLKNHNVEYEDIALEQIMLVFSGEQIDYFEGPKKSNVVSLQKQQEKEQEQDQDPVPAETINKTNDETQQQQRTQFFMQNSQNKLVDNHAEISNITSANRSQAQIDLKDKKEKQENFGNITQIHQERTISNTDIGEDFLNEASAIDGTSVIYTQRFQNMGLMSARQDQSQNISSARVPLRNMNNSYEKNNNDNSNF